MADVELRMTLRAAYSYPLALIDVSYRAHLKDPL